VSRGFGVFCGARGEALLSFLGGPPPPPPSLSLSHTRTRNIPFDDPPTNNSGFGFVEYEEADDAAAAVANMDSGEFFGRTLRVNLAQGGVVVGGGGGGGPGGSKHQPVWADADRYMDDLEREQALEAADAEAARQAAEARRREETAKAEAMEALEREQQQEGVGGGGGEKR
jgi:RNA recognition motif-containing protein